MRKATRIAAALAGLVLAGRLAAQTVTEFPIPTSGSVLGEIAAGPDGNLWFTEGGFSGPFQIGRITTTGVVT